MFETIRRSVPIAGALIVLTTSLAGCSSGPSVVQNDDLVSQITAKMTDASGDKPESVTCPQELKAEVGAQVNCEMKVKSQAFNVNVTVTSVSDNKVNFDMVETVDKNDVASEISDRLTEQIRRPDSVTCPDNLKGVTGATLECELTDGDQTYGVVVTVTDVEGGDVKFDFKVDDQPK
jgi:uncharacterized protein DUF4333